MTKHNDQDLNKEALRLHQFFKGKLQVIPKCRINDFSDFMYWYSPGVAEPCRAIHKDPASVYEYTNKGNCIAVISDGTRVLGLGDIGPKAAIPVMEGKGLLFKYLGGVDAIPICLATKNIDELVMICKALAPNFGGINLEDIESPKCFYLLERLQKELDIPVWHDDQQGTATVTLAGLINALKIVKKDKMTAKITMIGTGAANFATYRLFVAYGINPQNIIMVDSKGILNKSRTDVKSHAQKWEICSRTNKEQRSGDMAEALVNADACIALSHPGPDVIKKEWVAKMAKDAIVFACANPVPEIWPEDAKAAGVRIVATGRSDFPNQVNNSLCFPGLFRGVLDVCATKITDEMCLACAEALADAVGKDLSDTHILPRMDDWQVYVKQSVAIGKKAMELGVAKHVLTEKELFNSAYEKITRAREMTDLLMKEGMIEKGE